MHFIKKIIQYFKKGHHIEFINDEFNDENIEQQFTLLQTAYFQLHSSLNNTLFDTNLEIDAIGNYSVDGHNPWDEESKYSGSLQIQKNDNQYHLDWAVGISNIYQKGIGKVIKNFLVVHFDYKDKEHTFKGLVIYRQIDKDTLAGFWIEEGIFEVGFECLKLKNRGFQ